MQSLSEKIVQGILLELHHVVSEEKWGRLIEFVESELAVEQSVQADVCQCVREDYFELTEPDGSKSCSGCGKRR